MDGFSKADNYFNITYNGKDFIFPFQFNAADPNAVKGIHTYDNYIRLSHQHKFSNGWQLKSQAADVRGIYRGDGMYVSNYTAGFDTLYREYWYTNWMNGVQTAQIFLDGKFKTGSHIEHSFLTGFDYGKTFVNGDWGDAQSDTWGENNPLIVANPKYNINRNELRATLTMYDPYSYGTTWIAWYGQDHIKFYDKFIVTIAGRQSYTKNYVSWDTMTVYNTKFTPRFGLTYLLTKNMSVYTLYDETFLPQTGRKKDNTLPRPLTGNNIEFGYKAELFNNRLGLRLLYFIQQKTMF